MIKEWLPDIFSSVYRASEAIMEVYRGDFEVMLKEDDSPVTRADKQSNKILEDHLLTTGIKVVSEEGDKPNYELRKNAPIWLVDPLDGTKEFIKKNGEFCICIALIEDQHPTFGLIASPVKKQLLFGGVGIPTAIIDYGEQDIFSTAHQLEKVQQQTVNRVIYSRTHHTPNIDEIVDKMELRHGKINRTLKGSALKFFDLVLDDAQVYLRLWPTMEWDIAAGHAIYESLGGEIIDFTTFAPLSYNKESLYNPKFIAKPKNLTLF
ncbi:MAG: 3'(2'),5'-bisphosphate nucleotidase CysQ [Crocinitomicaceae bacterium]